MQFAGLLMLARRLAMSFRGSSACPNGSRCYSGIYHGGQAVYFYEDSSEGRIYDGKFWFSRIAYAQPRVKVKEKACGTFGNGKKQGRWLFTSKTPGLRRSLIVYYVDGRRSGKYMYCSKCTSRLLGFHKGTMTLNVEMFGHRLTGRVDYSFDGESLTGTFDSEGRPDGDWKMDSANARSQKIFHETWDHGACVSSHVFDVANR